MDKLEKWQLRYIAGIIDGGCKRGGGNDAGEEEMKKPEKKKDVGDLTIGHFEQARNCGYNQACDAWEKYHNYILKKIEDIMEQCLNGLAKAISKRSGEK